ncbi:hypothetical protein GEMRC1_003463 [Eukaryota sp. GEM-RC1]
MLGGLVGIIAVIIVVFSIHSSGTIDRFVFNVFTVISLIPGFLSVAIWFIFIHERFEPPPHSSERNGFVSDIGELGSRFYKILFVTSFFSLGFLGNSFGLMISKDMGLPLKTILFALLVSRLVGSIGGIWLPFLCDRFGIKGANNLGFLAHSIACVGFNAAFYYGNLITLFLAYGVFGFSISIHRTAAKTLCSLVTPLHHQGLAIGFLFCGIGLATTIGSFVTGWLFELNKMFPFWYGAVFGVLSMLFLSLVYSDSEFQEAYVEHSLLSDSD